MKKNILLIIIGLLVQIGFSQNSDSKKWAKFSKEKEIKFNEEHKLSGSGLVKDDFPITLLKDEIYENHKAPGDKDFIVFDKDTLRCPAGFDSIKVDKIIYSKLLDLKKSFIKKEKDKKIYKIDITNVESIYTKEQRQESSIRFIKNNKESTEFKTETSAQQIDLPKVTRLIIPGYPTLVYYEDQLETYTEPKPIQPIAYETIETIYKDSLLVMVGGLDNPKKIYKIHVDATTEGDLNKIDDKGEIKKGDVILKNETFFYLSRYTKITKGWIKVERFNYVLIVWLLLLIGVLFGLYKLLESNIGSPIHTKKYKGGSFIEFAENNGTTVKKLIKYNKSLAKYDKSVGHEDSDNQTILKSIQSKTLIKGSYFPPKKRPVSDFDTTKEADPKNESTGTNLESINITTDFSEIKTHISNEFKAQADFIKEELSSLKSDPEIEILNLKDDVQKKEKEISDLNGKLTVLEIEKTKLEGERDELNKTNATLKDSYMEVETNLKKYSNLASLTPFLMTLGQNYFDLLENLSECQRRINSLVLDEQMKLSDKEIYTIFKINTIFPNSFDTSYWRKLFKNMSEGYLLDPQLVTMIDDFNSENEKAAFMEKYIYDNFWGKYINTVLLHIEHTKFLSEFTKEKTKASTTIHKEATDCVETIISKSKELANYDINYVSLLEKYDKYKFTKVSSDIPEDFFLNLKTDEENIIQITSFGFKNNHGFETEETRVIIK